MLDTIHLLEECDAGTKMAVASIDEVMDKVTDEKLKGLLQESKNHHKELEQKIIEQLKAHKAEGKEPNPMAEGMSWIKTNMKMSMENSDATVADLITDGCNMGIKSLYKYLNQYEDADKKAKELCNKLIDIEETLRKDLRNHL